MPWGDRTGPLGMGPMTGRGFGYCAGYAAPGYANTGFGMGRRGRGFRRMHHMFGWARYGAHPYGFAPYAYGFAPYAHQGTAPGVDEKKFLQDQADFLQEQLNEVRERLESLEKAE